MRRVSLFSSFRSSQLPPRSLSRCRNQVRPPGNVGDDEGLNSNRNPWGVMLRHTLRHTEQRKSFDSAEALAYDRPPAIDPEDSKWKVEKLVKKRRIGRTVQYLVKWLGYPDSEKTWEKRKDIDPETVAAFEASLLLAQGLT